MKNFIIKYKLVWNIISLIPLAVFLRMYDDSNEFLPIVVAALIIQFIALLLFMYSSFSEITILKSNNKIEKYFNSEIEANEWSEYRREQREARLTEKLYKKADRYHKRKDRQERRKENE